MPVFPDIVHQWLGRLLTVAAVAALVVGGLRRDADIVALVVLLVSPFLLLVSYCVFQLLLDSGHHAKNDDLSNHNRSKYALISVAVFAFVCNAVFFYLIFN